MSPRLILNSLATAVVLVFSGCIGSRFHKPDPVYYKTPIERFRNNEEVVISVEEKDFPVRYLSKSVIDSFIALKSPVVFILHDPTCDKDSYEQIQSIAGVISRQKYTFLYISMSYEVIPKIIFTLPYNRTLYQKNIFVASNEDFSTGRWQKPANLASYILGRSVSKKEIASLFYILINDTDPVTGYKRHRFIEW